MLQLMEKKARPHSMNDYIRLVREASRTGATLGRILAVHLVPVFLTDVRLLNSFMHTVRCMLTKGTYTLNAPLEAVTALLAAGDRQSAGAYLDLLADTFKQDMSYNRSLRLVYLLPKAMRSFADRRRLSQIRQLNRVVATDLQLLDPFLDGMEKGLSILSAQALSEFVEQALYRYNKQPQSASRFLSLSSQVAQDCFAALQVAVPYFEFKGQLSRYLQARLGGRIALKSLSALPQATAQDIAWICSDGRFVYLAEEIDRYDRRDKNLFLGKILVRLEAGFFENKSYDFDLERASDMYPAVAARVGQASTDPIGSGAHDVYRFCGCFSRPALARDLLDLCEQARVIHCMGLAYPGLMRAALPVLADEVESMERSGRWNHMLAPLYASVMIHPFVRSPAGLKSVFKDIRQVCKIVSGQLHALSSVEACAQLVCLVFDAICKLLPGRDYEPFDFPFGRRLRWDLYQMAFEQQIRLAQQIKMRVSEQGVRIYRADVQNRLADLSQKPGSEDIQELILARQTQSAAQGVQLDWSKVDLDQLLRKAGMHAEEAASDGQASFYPEWDVHLQDYLNNHTRIQEVGLPAVTDGDFYKQTVVQHRGLVARTRRAFELLKPQGLIILRPWLEGDAFDYRAMLDFAIDRKAGRVPSDRLFVKRLKQQRDVAVLLLVDLSRSTANRVAGGHATVLDVAKQALVLFCEALQVIGDTYAIAGFSGTGRHCVDYYRIKDFQENLNDTVKARLSALSPQRSTRMGAALRHATAQLQGIEARVRLIIVISDGFPNDLGYKSEYAIADTRRAVQEARARNFHVKAITVNIGSDPRLDELYGRVHHHVIGEVHELPDKLLRLYGTLTRS
jgi:Mg-chelatase subunit ChlD